MATSKEPNPQSEPIPAEDRPQPSPMPTDGDEVREIGKRALDDSKGPKKDTDEAGYDKQRESAPTQSPTKRSGITDGSTG